MYLISNEFTLPAFSLRPAAPHRRGFYLVKKGFARVEHRRNSGRTESSLEFNSRTRTSVGGGGEEEDARVPPLVSHYPQQLLVFIFRIRSLPCNMRIYQCRCENEATVEMSHRAWRFSRMFDECCPAICFAHALHATNGDSAIYARTRGQEIYWERDDGVGVALMFAVDDTKCGWYSGGRTTPRPSFPFYPPFHRPRRKNINLRTINKLLLLLPAAPSSFIMHKAISLLLIYKIENSGWLMRIICGDYSRLPENGRCFSARLANNLFPSKRFYERLRFHRK